MSLTLSIVREQALQGFQATVLGLAHCPVNSVVLYQNLTEALGLFQRIGLGRPPSHVEGIAGKIFALTGIPADIPEDDATSYLSSKAPLASALIFALNHSMSLEDAQVFMTLPEVDRRRAGMRVVREAPRDRYSEDLASERANQTFLKTYENTVGNLSRKAVAFGRERGVVGDPRVATEVIAEMIRLHDRSFPLLELLRDPYPEFKIIFNCREDPEKAFGLVRSLYENYFRCFHEAGRILVETLPKRIAERLSEEDRLAIRDTLRASCVAGVLPEGSVVVRMKLATSDAQVVAQGTYELASARAYRIAIQKMNPVDRFLERFRG